MPTDAQIEALIKARNQRYGKAFTDLSVDGVLSFQSKTTVFNDVGLYSPFIFTFKSTKPDYALVECPEFRYRKRVLSPSRASCNTLAIAILWNS
jgi:hypothetical protein